VLLTLRAEAMCAHARASLMSAGDTYMIYSIINLLAPRYHKSLPISGP